MPTQQRKSRKNYIGILSDLVEGQRATEPLPKRAGPRMKDYLLGLMAALLKRGGEPR